MTDHKRNLYDALSTKFDIGTYEEFESKIDNEEHRKRLYDAVSQTYDIGTYDEYNAKLGYQSNVTADDEDRPSFGETAVKGLGAAAVRTGKLALDLGRMAWNTSVLGGAANKIRQWANPEQGTIDEELRDETNPLTRASMRLGEVADKLSREADPTGGEKGYVQLLKEGKIGQVAQKALGSGLESLPMMIAAGTGWGALLYGAGMAAGEYSDETRENPDIPAWKRGVNAMGSAAIEMAVEKIGGPLKNIGSAGKEITEEMAKEILETAVKEGTENAAKRIIKKIGKEGLEEGGEELLTSFGNDALGQALDWIDGDADYGITAQWEQMKEQNPDAKLSDFAWAKAEEYMDSFIGGAVSGMEISSTVEGANYLANRRAGNVMQAAREFGAAKNYGDMYDTDSYVASSTESVINAFAGNDGEQAVSNEFISSLSADGAFALSGREELSGEQRRALRQLAISKATQDGLNQKLDEELEKNLAVIRERTEKLSDNGQIVTGIYNGKPVYIKGGVVNNGSVSATNDGANGPVIVIDGATGEETTANSKDISSVNSVDLTTFINDSEAAAREAEAQNREIARNTMSVNAKYNAIRPLEGKKLKVDLGSGIIDVQIERILPQTGEVLIKGKKGDLNGQSNTKIGIGAFYDSIYRDDEGNPIFAEGVEFAEEESTDNTAVDEPIELTGEEDFRDFVGTILINGVPTEVEVMSQDNPTDSIVYTYIDENGRAQRGTTTIRGFAESVQQASSYNTEPAPQPEPAPTTEPIDEPISNGPSVDIPLTPQAIDWDVLFEQDPENYFVELQNQYGDETLDILNEEIEAAQEELDALGKKRGRTQNERLENRKKKATLQQRIEVLNGMVARLVATPETTQEAPADVATEQPSFESAEQVPTAAESPAESAAEVPQEDEPIQSIVKQTPVAPNPVANPVMEAQKKERLLAINLNKIMPHEQKQDMAFNAGKAVGDFFATREEYDAYAENATDFGEYNEDFERGIEASFANRSKIESVSPANSVSLETEPKGENNGENGQAYTGESSSGQSDRSSGVQQPANRRGEEIHQGTSEAEPEQGKNKGKGGKAGEQVDKYPARHGNATQKLLIDTFGFNSVTIPNSRKETLNTIYDFMMEMSKMLGISPKSISQGGWLDVESLRSNATASAEHSLHSSVVDQTVVKATLKYKYAKLAGLAHEWWHALDHALSYFETGKGKIVASEINRNKFTGRPEAWEAVQAVHEAIINSGHENRIFSLSFPKKYKDYLIEPSEMIARAFDEYIKSKFSDAGIVIENAIDTDFIAQPTPEEMAVIAPAFDNLFKVLKEKEGKTPGTSVLYHIGEMMEPQSDSKKFATEGVLTALDDGNREVVIMDDEQTKQYLKVIGADTDTQFSIDTDKPIFLSNAAIAVMGIKQEKATPEQWLRMIEKAGGLKAGEDKWMGLSDWLKAQDAKALTKQEVLDFINENTVRIEEVNYGEIDYFAEDKKLIDAINGEFLALREEAQEAGEFIHDAGDIAYEQMIEKYGDDFSIAFGVDLGELYVSNREAASIITGVDLGAEREINETRLGYTTDGLDNKKEIALIIPTIEPWNQNDEIHFGDAGDGRAVAWVRFGDAKGLESTTEVIAIEEFEDPYKDVYGYDVYKPRGKKSSKDFIINKRLKDGRTGFVVYIKEKAIPQLHSTLEEARVAMNQYYSENPQKRSINRRVLVIDEIQSKRHQEGREKGYKSQIEIGKEAKRIQTRLDEVTARLLELEKDRRENSESELTEIERLNIALDDVKSNAEYDAILEAQEKIRTHRENRDAEAASLYSERNELKYQLSVQADRDMMKLYGAIPDAPFDKNWHELAMKRMLRYAAENGYDVIAWTKGEQQAERYDLGNSISAIHYRQFADEMRIAMIIPNVGTERFGVDKNGVVVSSDSQYVTKGMNISEIFGKEIANKIINNEGEADEHGGKRISGDGLRIGGEGMKGFYDKMLPAFMNKYGKKWGVKVADITLPHVEEAGRVMHSVPVNDAMRESVMEGQPMFYKTPNGTVYGWTDGKKIYLTKAGLNPNTPIHEYTHLWAKAMMLRNPKGWESIKKLLKGTPIWNEVMNDANYSNIHSDEDLVASEALSRISGTENAAKMEQMAKEMIDNAKGTARKLEARGLIQNMRDALNKFWSWVGTNLFGIEKFESVEQITDRVLYDLLNNTDLGELSEGMVEAQISSGQNIGSEKNTNFVEQFEFKKENERQELEYSDEFRRLQEESARMSGQLVSEKDGVQQAAIRGLVGGIGRTLQRELDRATSGRGNKLRTVVNESKGTSFDIIENVDGRLFHDIFAIVKNYLPNGELVDLHDNYDDAICYITSDGLAGFAVTEDGNLISVYSLYGKTKKGFLGAIKDLITEAGATHLDGYNSPKQPLAEIYSKVFGWKVASMMDYNMGYDHDNIAKNHEMPQVAFMVNTDADIETRHFDKDQYDEAVAYQLEQVDKSKENSLISQNDGNTEDAYAANDGGRIQSETEGVSGEVPVSGPLGEGRKLARPEGRPVSQDAYARFNPIHEREGESDNRRNLREARFFETFEKLTSDEQLLFYNFLNEYLNKNSGVLKSKTNDFIESIMVDGNSEFADFVEDFINDELKYREGISAATAAKYGFLVGIPYDASRLEQIFDAYNNDKYNEALFDRAIKLAKRFGVSIKFATRNEDGSFFSAFGNYNPSDNTITLDANLLVDGNAAELCQTIVHELIHSVVARAASIMTGRAVDNNKQFIDPKSLPKDVVDGINTLKEVYEAIKDDGTFQYTYGKTDFEEMLSEITDPKFRGLLKAKKLWKKFLHGICQILGITDESSSETDALTEIESALDKILSAAERGELDSAYASYLGQLAEGYTLEDLQRLEDGSVKTLLTQNALFRTGIDPTEVARETAKQVYNRVVSEQYQEFQRQFQDAMQPVRIAIDAIQQETGNLPVEDYENFLLIQNQSSSRSRVEIDKFTRRYYSPIVKQVEKIIDMILESRGQNKTDKDLRAKVYGEIRKYMIAKHGLERNLYYQSHNTRKLRQSEKDKAIAEAQREYDDKVNAINADTSLTDAERELQLREAKDAFDAALLEIDTREVPDLRDYSGLTALFGMEPKKFKKAEEEAQVLVDNFEAQIGEASEELWKRINKATNKTLRHSYESGLLSRQQYNDIKEMFQFYIPLRGFDETTAEDVYSYARFEGNRFNPAVQTAKGRTSIADDPLAIIMNMAESEIAQGNKNRAKQALYNFILNRTITDADGNQRQNSLMQIEDVWYIKNEDSEGNAYYTIAAPNHESGETYEEFEERMKSLAEEEKAYKSKKGKVDVGMRFQKPANANAHYVYLKVNGVEKAIYINGDPKAAEAINGANREQLGEFAQKMRGINRILSSTFTNYSLEFTARNYFRDMIYSHINIGIREQDPEYRKKFRQNWRHNNLRTMMSLLKAYRAGEFEGRPLNEDEAAFVEFMENGGQTGYTLINSVENHKKDLERAIKNMQNGIEHGGVKDSAVFKATLGGIELLNESSELVTRFAAFKTSRDMGRSVVKSISDAKGITVNFNTKGAQDGKGYAGWIARYLGCSKFFFNASVQGVQNIKAMYDANKLKFCTTVGGIMAFGFAMPVIVSSIAALLGSDDEEEYWNIPEYDRQNNFCIPVGGGKYVKIPLPIGFREVYAMGDMLAAMAFDKKFKRDFQQIGMDMANKVASVVLPINPLESSANGLSIWHTLLYTALPSSMQFLVQNATNIDWKGAPLQKEYTYNENDPQWMKAYASNPDWMVSLSKWCNEHIGAGDLKGMDWSPEKLDNTLSNLFGGIYTLVKKTGKSFSMIWNEENRNLSNIPLSGVVLGSGIDKDDRFVTDAYYDEKEYYDDRIGFIKRRAEKFGYDLNDVFLYKKGNHHPKMMEIYNSRAFDFMQEWYKGNKDLEALENKIKKFEKEIAKHDNPSEGMLNRLAEMKDRLAVEKREFVDDMLELD